MTASRKPINPVLLLGVWCHGLAIVGKMRERDQSMRYCMMALTRVGARRCFNLAPLVAHATLHGVVFAILCPGPREERSEGEYAPFAKNP